MKLKISTLFHWLYATLMFLPILMFIPSCLYYGFNEHATNETTTTINYKYQSNEVNTIDDLVEGNIYHFKIDNDTIGTYFSYTIPDDNNFDMVFINVNRYNFANYIYGFDEIYNATYENNGQILVTFNLYNYEMTYNFYTTFNDTNDPFISGVIGNLATEKFTLEGDFIFYGSNHFVIHNDTNFISQTAYNVIESVETNVQQTIPQQISNAWNSVWNLPVFAWTQNSFVTAPFSYITGLFGLSSDNSINYVFTYFVSISICWLVFDLLMYVPNLAHRWLDRSALE